MIKPYSTETGKFYDTLEEAQAAEKAASQKLQAANIEKQVAEIKAKQVKEVIAAQNEIADINKKIVELDARKKRMLENIKAINDEAGLEIDELETKLDGLALAANTEKPECKCSCKKKAAVPEDECSIQIKTFNSDTDADWKTIIDKKGSAADIDKELKKILKDSDNSFKKILDKLGI